MTLTASLQTESIARVNSAVGDFLLSIDSPRSPEGGPVYLGIDIGTANVVTVAVDENGVPLSGEVERARVVREGMIVDYMSAVSIVANQIESLKAKLKTDFRLGASAYPPRTEKGNIRVTENILETIGLEVNAMIDEPSAAAEVLGITEGAVIDVGGGTTGVSVLSEGKVIHVADEPTGGFQFDLVIAGGMGISIDEAERRKCDPDEGKFLFPMVRPVIEKIASIVTKHIAGYSINDIYLVGGACGFGGFSHVIGIETGLNIHLPEHPMFITPLGIARICAKNARQLKKGGDLGEVTKMKMHKI